MKNCHCGHSEEECTCHIHEEEVVSIPSSELFLAKHGQQADIPFPCSFPIKVFGLAEDNFLEYAYNLILPHAPDTLLSSCTSNMSKNGKYIAVTVTIKAVSREQLDKIYSVLKNDPKVKAML